MRHLGDRDEESSHQRKLTTRVNNKRNYRNESGSKGTMMELGARVSMDQKAPRESVSYSGAGEDGAGCSDMKITTMELGAPVKNKNIYHDAGGTTRGSKERSNLNNGDHFDNESQQEDYHNESGMRIDKDGHGEPESKDATSREGRAPARMNPIAGVPTIEGRDIEFVRYMQKATLWIE
jgi:hypothetical protein